MRVDKHSKKTSELLADSCQDMPAVSVGPRHFSSEGLEQQGAKETTMSQSTLGSPLEQVALAELSDQEKSQVNFSWELDSESKKRIEEIERHIRLAEHQSGRILVG